MSFSEVQETKDLGAGMNLKGFTVITVVRNNLIGLKKTHDCLIKQTNQQFTWLVMDGLSTDGTREWMNSLKMDRLVFISEKDNSLFDAMNKAILRLNTEYCIFLNGGDFFWENQVVEKIMRVIHETPFQFAFGQYVIGGLPGFPTRERGSKINRTWEIFYGRMPCHQTSIISRQAFAELGGYREDIGIYGDREWMLRYSKKHPPSTFLYLPFVIAYCDPNGLSYQQFFKYRKIFMKMYWDHGNPLEFALGILGWCKTALYIIISEYLNRQKLQQNSGIGENG